ncbi:hypothetical protein BKM31_43925 [[Actinomadura] parvosata subsp. kistnae]|uniref:23S rRNA (guanine(745)-N(1))-methyltransferase N-terminal domain-containing protein n=1 Tax=[Actinomadura] parvosata subsp. kistnae TaxID=1909395 RepID=A0A1V0ABI6_9ACTN|nr:hypothetical protein [Nonomuraea sp. ATCC 55076]AQZ67492.1 hypothetical protein BKM31_43925 [Nonomuraea sp. ATCC 55076]
MLADIVDYLICPVCRAELRLAGPTVRCAAGHTFDVAKQGYVSLLTGSGQPGTADTAEMVAARAAFLDKGHYAPLTDALAETVRAYVTAENVPGKHESSTETHDDAELRAYRETEVEAGSGPPPAGGEREPGKVEDHRAAGRAAPVIVDAGAGTGHYLAAVLNAVDDGIGMAFDVSKHAVRRAARVHPRAGAFVADVWRPLPIRSGVADVVIDVFAPRNGPEFRRVLRPGGAAVVVTPAPSISARSSRSWGCSPSTRRKSAGWRAAWRGSPRPGGARSRSRWSWGTTTSPRSSGWARAHGITRRTRSASGSPQLSPEMSRKDSKK